MSYYVNNEKYDMVSGDIVYLPAGSMRQRDIGDGHNDYVSINFHAKSRLALKPYISKGITEEIGLLLTCFDAEHKNPTTINHDKLIFLLQAMIMQISDNVLASGKLPLSTEIANYLMSHYSEHISLEDISNETFFSVAYCESEFKKAYGKSIIRYLIDLRIAEAKKLLTDTSLPCSVIANMVGFDDANYFSRVFKNRIGISPLQYRATLI
jgi:YesN/AraC family two-component response regulator